MKTNSFVLFFLYLLFSVSCSESVPDPSFSITAENVSVGSEEGAQVVVNFTSARDWKASATANWFSVSPSSGSAGTFDLIVTANSTNDTDETRTATLVLTSGGLKRTITLQQELAKFVRLEQDSYIVPAKGGTLEIKFSTNIAGDELKVYGSKNSTDWLTSKAPDTRALSSYVVRLTVLPNTESESRSASIYFVREVDSKEEVLDVVAVTQLGLSAGGSTDYSDDKKVRVLQTASQGQGIPIVLLGDGFIDKEIAAGTYDKIMDKAMENLFTEEPIKSLREYFNVYAVTAVSTNNTFGEGYSTAFSCKLEGGGSTGISGDADACVEYALCVPNLDLDDALVVVVLNTPVYAGTTYFGYTSETTHQTVEFAIAYCPVINNMESETFRQVLVHEAIGHGFGKLLDEYAYTEQGTIPDRKIKDTKSLQTLGWAQNVDFTSNRNEVLWAGFLSDSRYASEDLGVYEGACTYIKGAYRPSQESMMRSNIKGFNAPSRRALYDRTMKTGMGTKGTYEEFVDFDLRNRSQTRSTTFAVPGKPFAHPRFTNKMLIKK
ncbi:M64 family metallopeptidase [Bacteroides sp.]